ncbi:unnamed protein product [Lepeophtheirus salmonis]|uniref:(salmon louse) hypothetical protein n=1 Tax=Lepeophtheirus salmonis TaxID=72036 RepID=A0A7R8CYI7_LEPSM|nr:unnamed protein product [Lepeophtheirus salmonis]CAF2941564.1 unnamed protein product [Lepeophtheirus salmonis]
MADAKFKLDDILNKQKAPPQILDLVNLDIQTEEEYQAIIEKIPDYKIRPEKPEEIHQQIEALSKSLREYKLMRKKLDEAEKIQN